jgi:hypothetical protein
MNTQTILENWRAENSKKYCGETPCETRQMLGCSWWKNLGYGSPCRCAYTASKKIYGRQYAKYDNEADPDYPVDPVDLKKENEELKKEIERVGKWSWSEGKQSLINEFMEKSGNWCQYREWVEEYHPEEAKLDFMGNEIVNVDCGVCGCHHSEYDPCGTNSAD